MKKKHIGFALLAVLATIIVIGAFTLVTPKTKPVESVEVPKELTPEAPAVKPVDDRASFVIFANGGIRIFTDSKYHNQSPDAFITGDETTIIKVKKDGVTWQQFFDSLPAPMKVTSDCLYTGTGQTFCTTATKSLKFYRNGKLEPNLLLQPIQDGDKVLVSYGATNADVSAELNKVPNPR